MDSRALIGFLVLVAFDAAAGGIYKCVDGGATSYQATPCGRGQDEVPIRIAGVSAQAARDQPLTAPVPAAQPRKRGPWTHATPEIGVSDDEVLNMPGWGRPTHIFRARVGRAWEEVWRYGNSYNGERELRFVNARLADIVEAPATVAYAR